MKTSKFILGSASSKELAKTSTGCKSQMLNRVYTKPLCKESLIETLKEKNNLIHSIAKTESEIDKKVKEQKKKLNGNHFLVSSKTQGSLWCATSGTIERLLESERIKQEKLEARKAKYDKLIKGTLQDKPEITGKSRKINETKEYLPLYSKERINKMEREKRRNMELLKGKINSKISKTEEESIFSIHRKSYTSRNGGNTFEPSKNSIFKTIHNSKRDTTEEEELSSCTFTPMTNKNSNAIFSKINAQKKPVVQRLINYGKYRKEMLNQQVEDSKPSFQPQTGNKTKKIKSNTSLSLQKNDGNEVNKINELIMSKFII